MYENDIKLVEEIAYDEGYKQGRYDEMVETKMSSPKWIPCDERLPEVKIGWDSEVNTYLVTVDDGAIYTDIDIIRKSGFNKYRSNVTAWQPLPKPYKDGDDNV